ncbi:MAG TPA: hypothetical protein VKI19_08080 [Acidimicrobiales bacterium]|nr:hypothetical protein [Acidimicrobiales bacterium]
MTLFAYAGTASAQPAITAAARSPGHGGGLGHGHDHRDQGAGVSSGRVVASGPGGAGASPVHHSSLRHGAHIHASRGHDNSAAAGATRARPSARAHNAPGHTRSAAPAATVPPRRHEAGTNAPRPGRPPLPAAGIVLAPAPESVSTALSGLPVATVEPAAVLPLPERWFRRPLSMLESGWAQESLHAAGRMKLPIALLGAVALFILIQSLVDRRDPKLNEAPERPVDDSVGFQ